MHDFLIAGDFDFEIPKNIMDQAKNMTEKLFVVVYIILQCPYCPDMAVFTHLLSKINKNVISYIVASEYYPESADKFKVYSVPRVIAFKGNKVITDFEGLVPLDKLIERILKGLEGTHEAGK